MFRPSLPCRAESGGSCSESFPTVSAHDAKHIWYQSDWTTFMYSNFRLTQKNSFLSVLQTYFSKYHWIKRSYVKNKILCATKANIYHKFASGMAMVTQSGLPWTKLCSYTGCFTRLTSAVQLITVKSKMPSADKGHQSDVNLSQNYNLFLRFCLSWPSLKKSPFCLPICLSVRAKARKYRKSSVMRKLLLHLQ